MVTATAQRRARDMDAWRKTRKEKDPAVMKKDVVAAWRERAGELPSRTAAENRAAAIADRERWFKEASWSVEAKQELAGVRATNEIARWQNAVRRATDKTARVSADAVITEYLTELGREETWEPITYSAAHQRLLAQVQVGHILQTDEGRFTTWELARADRECYLGTEMESAVRIGAGAARDQVKSYSAASKAAGRRFLSSLQLEAAAGILASDRGVVVVQGDAGAGKTTMLQAVHNVAAAAGWEILGVALQGVAARKLQEESNIPSRTLAAYLAQERAAAGARGGELDGRRSRLIAVDEASMLDSRGLSELLKHAERAGDKVVLVGDRNQLQSIGAGKPFERLVVKEEKEGRLLSLSENHRQKTRVLQEAVSLAREGRMRESLDLLDGVGKLEERRDNYDRRRSVAKNYDAGTLILTGTRDSRDVINKMIREELVRKGELAQKSARRYALKWTDADGIRHSASRELAVGERVTFLENEYKLYDIRNGEVGTVTKTADKTISVRLEDSREISIEVARYAALDYGYALTTYKSQGQTYDRVVVEADTRFAHLQDQRNCYVQITRARLDVTIYTDDRETLRDVAGVLSVKQDTLDLKESLSRTVAMEQRVRAAALGSRAREEAAAKVARAGADAQRDAERLMGAAMGDAGEGAKNDDEPNESSSGDASASKESRQEHQSADPARRQEASQSPAERPTPESGPSDPFSSYPSSVTDNVGNFNALLGEKPLEGAAEILRGELVREIAKGKSEDEAIDLRIAILKQTSEGLTKGKDRALAAPEDIRRVILERLVRDVHRLVMLEEPVSDETIAAGKEIWASMPENGAAPELRVRNVQLLANAGESELVLESCFKQLSAVEARLKGRDDLDTPEKQRVVDYLGKPESAQIFDAFMGKPDEVIAAGLVGGGVRDVDGATVGMSPEQKSAVVEYLRDDGPDGADAAPGPELGLDGPEIGE